MRAETWRDTAKDTLKLFYDRKSVRDKDLRGPPHEVKRRLSYIYSIRDDLIERGIIKRVDRRYQLVLSKFRRRDEILRYVNFIRSGNPMYMKIGAMELRNIFMTHAIPKTKDFEEFLQVTNLQALIEGEDVVEVTHIKEVWKLFVDVLSDIREFTWLLKYLTKAILGALKNVKRYGYLDLLKTPMNGKVLDESLHVSIEKAIFYFVGSEELYYRYEKIVIKLFRILQELDNESKYLVSTIKELLRRSSSNRGRFSILSQPLSDNLHPLGARRLPNLWYTTNDYSDLFKAIYRMLRKLGKERMRKLLLEWVTDADINLRFNAWLFLNRLLNRDP